MQQEAIDTFALDENTGVLTWIKPSKYHKEKTGTIAGFPRTDKGKTYWIIKWKGKAYRRSQLVYLMVHGKIPRPVVDHINSNSTDDRPSNLREASFELNARNHIRTSIRKTPNGKYQARIAQKVIGTFANKDLALEAYRAERLRLWQT